MRHLSRQGVKIQPAFRQFLLDTDADYRQKLAKIALFCQKKTSTWNNQQKKAFCKCFFYHLRGHSVDFMWSLGNFSPDGETKKIIHTQNNIKEELGSKSRFS